MEKTGVLNPKDFLNRLYKDLEGHPDHKMLNLQEKWACEAFFVITECDSCLQIGCGPVLNLAACASRKCHHIYLADYSDQCLELVSDELQKIGHNNQKYFWSERFQVIAKIEDINQAQVYERLRQRVTACFRCDLARDRILDIQYIKKLDVITTSLTVQCVAKDELDYKRIVKNIRKLLGERRFLYMFGSLGETFYKVKDQKIPVFPLSETLIKQTLVELDFQILIFNAQKHQNPEKQPQSVSDNQGFFCVLAQSYV